MKKTRLFIAAMIYPMINALIFGAGAVLVLSVPMLSQQASVALPIVIATAFVSAAPIAWYVAPRLRYRFWRRKGEEPGFPLT